MVEYNGNQVAYYSHPFIIITTSKDILIINIDGAYENHAHLRRKTDKLGNVNLQTAIKLIESIKNKRYIKSHYLRTAAKRLSLDEDYLEYLARKEQNKKQKYYNHK